MSDRAARSSPSSLVAAYVVWAASCDAAPAALIDRQTDLTQFLQRQERPFADPRRMAGLVRHVRALRP